MKIINLSSSANFEDWRRHARICLSENIPPQNVVWGRGDEIGQDLFALDSLPITAPIRLQTFTVSREFFDLASIAVRHHDSKRFALLYRLLWRLHFDNKNLLRLRTDDDVLRLHSYVKAVRRDAYKIKAFLRFRETEGTNGSHFIAWYEPEHYSLELSLPFFQTRFRNMTWSILTPYVAAHWDQESLLLQDNPDPSQYPKEDQIETYWLKYYATTFNPARPKQKAMLNQMPKKYWKNMPESVLIQSMLRGAEARTRDMLDLNKN